MAIEKGLYNMPEGIDEELMGEMGEPDAMIEMAIATDEDTPVMVELEDGSVEISFGEEIEDIDAAPFDANLADYLDDKQLQEISSDLCEAIEGDMSARRDWADSYVQGLMSLASTTRSVPSLGKMPAESTLISSRKRLSGSKRKL
jgi:hypothetical protein